MSAAFDGPMHSWSIFAPPPGLFAGEISGDSFRAEFNGWTQAELSSWDKKYYPRPIVSGRVLPDGDGSIIVGEFGAPSRRLFWFAQIGFCGSLAVALTAAALATLSPGAAIGLPVLAGFVLLALWGLRHDARLHVGHAQEIVARLEDAVSDDPSAPRRPRRGRRGQ